MIIIGSKTSVTPARLNKGLDLSNYIEAYTELDFLGCYNNKNEIGSIKNLLEDRHKTLYAIHAPVYDKNKVNLGLGDISSQKRKFNLDIIKKLIVIASDINGDNPTIIVIHPSMVRSIRDRDFVSKKARKEVENSTDAMIEDLYILSLYAHSINPNIRLALENMPYYAESDNTLLLFPNSAGADIYITVKNMMPFVDNIYTCFDTCHAAMSVNQYKAINCFTDLSIFDYTKSFSKTSCIYHLADAIGGGGGKSHAVSLGKYSEDETRNYKFLKRFFSLIEKRNEPVFVTLEVYEDNYGPDMSYSSFNSTLQLCIKVLSDLQIEYKY